MTCPQHALWAARWGSDWGGSTYRQRTTCRPQTSNTRPACLFAQVESPSSPSPTTRGRYEGVHMGSALCGIRYRNTPRCLNLGAHLRQGWV